VIELLAAAALMGFVGSVHCVGMCGPFALACGGRTGHVLAWQAGKMGSYAMLGGLAGLSGALLPGPAWIPQLFSAALIVFFGGAAAGFWTEPSTALPGLTRLAARHAGAGGLGSRALFGAANGLLPCGLVYAALGLAVSAGRPATGALAMVAFGLGTAPLVTTLALSAHRLAHRHPRARRALAVVAALAGLWVVVGRGGAMDAAHLMH
jgi:sulfite exporter TauE/SafE